MAAVAQMDRYQGYVRIEIRSAERISFFEKLTVRSEADIRTCKNPRIITERIFRLDNDTDRSGADYPY